MTEDSFSDGNQFLEPKHALRKIEELLKDGADWIEISGQSSNVSATLVPIEEEIRRIRSILTELRKLTPQICLDSFRPEVQSVGIQEGVLVVNDISGFSDPKSKMILQPLLLQNREIKLIVMHSHTLGIARKESILTTENILQHITAFFKERQSYLSSWGLETDRLYFDPGMGMFLGEDANLSFTALAKIDVLLEEYPNLMVSVSRKSFLGSALGGIPPLEREVATLVCEQYLVEKGVPWIRTHNIKKIKQAEIILKRIKSMST